MDTKQEKLPTAQDAIHKGGTDIKSVTDNIPGGVFACKADALLSFVSVSASFYKLVGYTASEVANLFNNSFANMIYPDDLADVQEIFGGRVSRTDITELEYRIMRKDGRLLWILHQARRTKAENCDECYNCMLMNITRKRQERETLRLSLERHQIILDQASDIIFEWDIHRDSMIYSSNWHKKFGYEPIATNVSQDVPSSMDIYPDDRGVFNGIVKNCADGVPYSEGELRIRDAMGGYRWNRVRATVQYDGSHHPIKAVGVILDIDADVRQRERLMAQAQLDPLTSLYNKAAIHELAELKMNADMQGNHAMLIIDVDNFKSVNDTYGHLCGDTLLSDIAGVLRNNVRESDLVGRIGGDEFLVYFGGIHSEVELLEKANELLVALRTLRAVDSAPYITCSIGIAMQGANHADYFKLYKHADQALYTVKARGRNDIALYDPANKQDYETAGINNTAVGGIDSEVEGATDTAGDKLAQYTFRMLYNAIDIHTAVPHLLEIVGRAYDVSRVYIFESSQDGTKCSNTFEWCNVGIASELDILQNLDYIEDLGDYQRNFDDKGILYCRDISELHPSVYNVLVQQGICSILQCAIMDDGVFKGYVGFDECKSTCAWTRAQVASLSLIANVLSIFLIKQRLKENK